MEPYYILMKLPGSDQSEYHHEFRKKVGTLIDQSVSVKVATGDKVIVEPILHQTLSALFGGQQVQQTGVETPSSAIELGKARIQLAELRRMLEPPVAPVVGAAAK